MYCPRFYKLETTVSDVTVPFPALPSGGDPLRFYFRGVPDHQAFSSQSLLHKLLSTHCIKLVTEWGQCALNGGDRNAIGVSLEASAGRDDRCTGQRQSSLCKFPGWTRSSGPHGCPWREGVPAGPQTTTGRELEASRGLPTVAPVSWPRGWALGGVLQCAAAGTPALPALAAFPWEQIGVCHRFLWHRSPWHLLALKNTD